MKSRILSLLLAVCMVLALWPAHVFAASSGYCGGEGDGTNLTWTLDDAGTLTISGSGAMANWSGASSSISPWYGNRSSIKTVIIENGVTSIGNCAFMGCYSLTSVEIANSVTSIGLDAFESCSSLTSVTIGNSVTSIGDNAFQNCSSLNNITIPDSVTSIGIFAFYECVGLTNIEIPYGVTSIEGYTFNSCSSLTSIGIPASVTTIGQKAFDYCTSLHDIYYGGTEAQWNEVTKRCSLEGITVHFLSHLRHDGISFAAWESTNALPNEAGSYYLTNDVTISDTWSVPSGTTNLCLNGHRIFESRTISVGSGATLNIYDCGTSGTIRGASFSATGGVIYIEGGTVSLYGGTITNGAALNGGGVGVNGGAFNMYGGTVTSNTAGGGGNSSGGYGGGIYATNSAVVTIAGGTISNNLDQSYRGGGGVAIDNATLNMSGGEIVGNEARVGDGGGVLLLDSTFTMSGGEIRGNKASTPVSQPPYIYGGGVYVGGDSTFTMNDGVIENNNVENGNGGGVYVYGTFLFNDGEIKRNQATRIKGDGNGGGCYVCFCGDMTMYGGSITENHASGYGGGAIYVQGKAMDTVGKLTINAGKVTGNTSIYYVNGNRIQAVGGIVNGGNLTLGSPEIIDNPGGSISTETAIVFSEPPINTRIGVCYSGVNPFTSGLEGNRDAIVNERTGYSIELDSSGQELCFVPNTYTVSFETNGGNINSGNITSYTYGTFTSLPTNVTRTGHTFKGWYDNPEFTGSAITYIEMNEFGDKVFYANWEINQYTVTWKNGNTTINTEKVAYGTTPEYTGETPTKAPTAQYTYTFTGWDPEIVPVTGDAIYKAQFSETVNKYTVTWMNGEETLKTEQVAYGETPVYTGDPPTKAPTAQYTYAFIGWSPEIVPVTGNATYTAQFSETLIQYSVTFDNNGGTGTMAPQTETPGTQFSLTLNSFTRENYTFIDWNTEPDGSGVSYANEAVVTLTGDMTLYAQWSKAVIHEIQIDEADNQSVNVTIDSYDDGLSCYCARYDGAGRFLDVTITPLNKNTNLIKQALDGAAVVRVFVLDTNHVPVCAAAEYST